MKKVLIVHAWESSPNDHWYREEEKILVDLGYEVIIPQMPGHSFPIEEEWVGVVSDFQPDLDTVLIGHSLGVPTILRYLENSNQKVGKIILIAGFSSSLQLDYPNSEYPDAFVNHAFDWKKIKQMATKFIVMNQTEDPWVPLSVGYDLVKCLDVEIIRVEGNNHFDTMNLDLINKELL